MKRFKRMLFIILPLVFICVCGLLIQNAAMWNYDEVSIKRWFMDNKSAILTMLDAEPEHFGYFEQQRIVTSIKRISDKAWKIYFSTKHPEKTQSIIVSGIPFTEVSLTAFMAEEVASILYHDKEYSMEGLGTDGSGYIRYSFFDENCVFYESFIPT